MPKYGAIQENNDDNTSVGSVAFRRSSSNESNAYGRLAPTWLRVTIITAAIVLVLAFSPTRNNFPGSSSDTTASTLTILGMLDDNPSEDDHDPNEALFWEDQLVNHFSNDTSTWSNRYYKSTKYYKGAGSPIFLVVGGEGALEKMLYPFITEHLAPRFGAAVIQIEHRFYGPYQPIMGREASVKELLELLTPQQAMADMIYLTKHFKDELGCSEYTRESSKYCPVIAVGGSYPGFLSAMFRLVYPDFVDISYASSAPLKLYDQSTNQYVYYDIVTEAAEHMSKGCAKSVRDTLEDASEDILNSKSVKDAIKNMNMWCVVELFFCIEATI